MCVQSIVVVVAVHDRREAELLQVAQIDSLLRSKLRLGEDWEQDGCENSDDRDDDQKLNEGKCFLHEGFRKRQHSMRGALPLEKFEAA